MPKTEKTDAEKLADARAEVTASQERLRAAQEAEAPIIAAAAEVTKAIQLPHAEAFVALMEGKEAKAFRGVLEAHVAASMDDIPKPSGVPGVEGSKQMGARILSAMRVGLDAARIRIASLQPIPAAEPPSVAPAPADA